MIYEIPQMEIVLFNKSDVITASEDTNIPATTQRTTGAGSGVVLPDDDWSDVL